MIYHVWSLTFQFENVENLLLPFCLNIFSFMSSGRGGGASSPVKELCSWTPLSPPRAPPMQTPVIGSHFVLSMCVQLSTIHFFDLTMPPVRLSANRRYCWCRGQCIRVCIKHLAPLYGHTCPFCSNAELKASCLLKPCRTNVHAWNWETWNSFHCKRHMFFEFTPRAGATENLRRDHCTALLHYLSVTGVLRNLR